MPKYQTVVITPWSPDRAFAYLSDLCHFADWDPGVKRSVQVDGVGPGIGASYDVTVSSPGRDLTLRYETVVFEPPRRIEVRAESSNLLSVDLMTLEANRDAGTTVTYSADLSLRGVLAIGNPALALAFRRIGDRAARGLRHALEGVSGEARPQNSPS